MERRITVTGDGYPLLQSVVQHGLAEQARCGVPEAPKEVIVCEILDPTARIKRIAEWGIDDMHLIPTRCTTLR